MEKEKEVKEVKEGFGGQAFSLYYIIVFKSAEDGRYRIELYMLYIYGTFVRNGCSHDGLSASCR